MLAPSPIVLDLDADSLGYGMAITGSETASADTTYPIVAGKAAGRARSLPPAHRPPPGARRRQAQDGRGVARL
ncbi:MAG: hypothetical protein WDN44_02005 [Sphingomonas sp.]